MKKRIAFIASGMETLYMQKLVSVISKAVNSLGYDLIILTHFVNYYNDSPYIRGEEDVYTLIESIKPDGAVVVGGSFFHSELVTEIEEKLLKMNIPAVALDYSSRLLKNIIQDNRECFRMITEHFITVHGFSRIALLSGPEGNVHSAGREEGYREALSANGIPYDEKLIVHGDFWLESPKKLAADIANGSFPHPEAVVCANDYMAFQLSISLAEAGIKVPDDIAIGGYDGNPDLDHFSVFPTTVSGAYLNSGIKAVEAVHEMITGEKCSLHNDFCVPHIRTGMSCGCSCDMTEHSRCSEMQFNIRQKNNVFMCCDYASVMSEARTMDDCAIGILSHMYLLDNLQELCVYLFSSDTEVRTNRYASCIFRYEGQYIISGERIRVSDAFSVSDTPAVYLCTPLHHHDKTLGFCVRRGTEGNFSFESYYGEFCQIISGTVNQLRIKTEEADRMQCSSGHVYFASLESVRNKVFEEPQLQWDAEEQAAEIGISISHFRHLYKQFFATGFNADVTEARLALARRLLKTTDMSVLETARSCGYTDESYFMKLFKKHVGITALAYRKQ